MRKRTARNPKDRRKDNSVGSVLGGFLPADRRSGADRRRQESKRTWEKPTS
jgi:hypothetical protein